MPLHVVYTDHVLYLHRIQKGQHFGSWFQLRYRSNTPSLPSTKPLLSSRNLCQQATTQNSIRIAMFQRNKIECSTCKPIDHPWSMEWIFSLCCLLDGVEVGGNAVGSLVTHPALPSICGLEQDAAPTSSPRLILQWHCMHWNGNWKWITSPPIVSLIGLSGCWVLIAIPVALYYYWITQLPFTTTEVPVSDSRHQESQTPGSALAPPQSLQLSTHGNRLLLHWAARPSISKEEKTAAPVSVICCCF